MDFLEFKMPVIFVDDIRRSKAFYEEILGLEIEHDFGENVSFKRSISLWEKDKAQKIIFDKVKQGIVPKDKDVMELYFEIKDIIKILQEVNKKNIKKIHGLKEEPWGQRVFRILDPDGFIIEIAEPMEEVVKRFHRDGYSADDISTKTQLDRETVKNMIS